MHLIFADKATEDIFNGRKSKESLKRLPVQLHLIAQQKLEQMLSVVSIFDLRFPPGNRLEKLKGNLKDFYSIRINNQFRIIFRSDDGFCKDVEIVDYH